MREPVRLAAPMELKAGVFFSCWFVYQELGGKNPFARGKRPSVRINEVFKLCLQQQQYKKNIFGGKGKVKSLWEEGRKEGRGCRASLLTGPD